MGKKHKKHHRSERRDFDDDPEDELSHSEMIVEEKSEKPLKLVLKVGGSQTNVGGGDTPVYSAEESHDHHEKRHKHKKKKKKKSSDKEKHRHSEQGEERRERKRERHSRDSEDEYEPPTKKIVFAENPKEKRPALREPAPGQPERLDDTVLYDSLDYIHKTLQRKDVNAFFAYPVNDVIAPGYSSIISQPMDLSTMRTKMDNGDYSNVVEYKRDCKLMCDNAMMYNHPDTIYYKAAKKLLHQGLKLMSKERLIYMRRTLPFMINITDEELGLDVTEDDTTLDQTSDEPKENRKKSRPSLSSANSFEGARDDMTPEEILESAQAAAKSAADKLTLRNPDSHVGFLRRQKDGSTTMQILNPDNSGIVSETEKVVNLGSLVGKLNTGTGGIPTFKEDRRNVVKPVTYLDYGPYGTYCPTYDSSFATLTKEESDLILSTYGDETCTEYATSIQDFVEDCSTGADIIRMVDNLLDIVTGGEHKKTKKIVEDNLKEREAKKKQEEKEKEEAEQKKKEESSRKSPTPKEKPSTDSGDKVDEGTLQTKLDTTAGLINKLQKAQQDRLSQKLPAHLAYVPGPSTSESQLAEKVAKSLADATKQVKPGDVVSQAAVRKALGITMEPVESPTQSEESLDSAPAGSVQHSEAGSSSGKQTVAAMDVDLNQPGDGVSPVEGVADELDDFAAPPTVHVAEKSVAGMEVDDDESGGDDDSDDDSGDDDDDDDDSGDDDA